MTASGVAWSSQITAALQQRDQKVRPLTLLASWYGESVEVLRTMLAANASHERTLSGSDDGDAIRSLQDRCMKLQEQVLAHSTRDLQLMTERTAAQDAERAARAEASAAQANLQTAVEREQALRREHEEVQAELQLIRNALQQSREATRVAEAGEAKALAENAKVREEHGVLIDRYLADKAKAAAHVNDLNEEISALKSHVDALLHGRGDDAAAAAAAEALAGSTATAAAGGGDDGAGPDVEHLGVSSPEAAVPLPGSSILKIPGHESAVNALAFSESSAMVASAGADKTVRVWDTQTGRLRSTLTGAGGSVNSVDFLGGAIVAGCADRTVRLWDVSTERIRRTLTGHMGRVCASCFSHGGRGLVTAGTDRCIKVWDLSVGRCVRSIPTASNINDVAITADGRFLASAHQNRGVMVWDARNGARIAEAADAHDDIATSVCFLDDSGMVMSAGMDDRLRLYDGRTLAPLAGRDMTHPRFRIGYKWVRAAIGPALASPRRGADKANMPIGAWGLAACGSADGSVVLWCAARAQALRAFVPPDRMARGGRSGSVASFTPEAGKMKAQKGKCQTIEVAAHSGEVGACVWSRDGRQLATGDQTGSIVVWQ